MDVKIVKNLLRNKKSYNDITSTLHLNSKFSDLLLEKTINRNEKENEITVLCFLGTCKRTTTFKLSISMTYQSSIIHIIIFQQKIT